MQLGSITEFGAPHLLPVLGDLRYWAACRNGSFPTRQYFVATLGSTDLVEICLFNHNFHLNQVGGSSAQVFRRSTGVLVYSEDELRELVGGQIAPEVTSAEQILEEDPDRPFVSVLYAKLSTVVPLAVAAGYDGGRPILNKQLLRHCASEDWDVWGVSKQIVRSTRRLQQLELGSLLVAPLLGLDAVELVLIVRARSLEEIAAFAFAVRHTTTRALWPARKHREAFERTRALYDLPPETDWWDDGPLFDGSSSIVGIPVRYGESDSLPVRAEGQAWPPPRDSVVNQTLWRVEVDVDLFDRTEAAESGALLSRLTFDASAVDRILAETKDWLHGRSPVGSAHRFRREGDESSAVLALFDRNDLLLHREHPQLGSPAFPLRTLYLGELVSSLQTLLTDGKKGSAVLATEPGVTSQTDLCVLLRVGEFDSPDPRLPRAFVSRLRDLYRFHRARSDEEGSWLRRWLTATSRVGTTYPVANGGVALAETTLMQLSDDFIDYSDLLPVIERLVDVAEHLADGRDSNQSRRGPGFLGRAFESEGATASDLVRLYEMAEELASSRARLEHPLRSPRTNLPVQGHAGHRLVRDAFGAFAHAISVEIGEGRGPLMVLDSPGGGLSCEVVPVGGTAMRVSVMALHHPLYYAFAHEAAHGRMEHQNVQEMAKDEDPGVQQHLDASAEKLREMSRTTLQSNGTIGAHFDGVATALRAIGLRDTAPDLFEALACLADEIPGDLVLHDSLTLPGDHPKQSRGRFWFVAGPALLFATQHRHGFASLEWPVLAALMLRIWLVDGLLSGNVDSESPLLGQLDAVVDAAMAAEQPVSALAPSDLETLLRALYEDLSPDPAMWRTATVQLAHLRGRHLSQDESLRGAGVSDLLGGWLQLVLAVRGVIGTSPPPHGPRTLFASYIDQLMLNEQELSIPASQVLSSPGGDRLWVAPRPWPPAIPGHDRDAADTPLTGRYQTGALVLCRRGGPLATGEGQLHYNRLTWDLLLKLSDAGRAQRFERLGIFLQSVR